MVKEFKEFILRGNVMDMAVGIIIGVAFGAVISSLVADVIMPPIGLLLGKVDFANLFAVLKHGATPGPYPSVAAAKTAGAVTLNFGLFFNTIINFVILAFVIFLMVKGVNQLRLPKPAPAAAPTTKDCPYCFTSIPIKATRCPNCTSELKA
jgi:large conductance mechanosensitive channel